MFCFRVKRLIYDLVEGSLKGPLVEKTETHIKGCPTCRKRYDEMKGLLDLASKKKVPEQSAAFWTDFDKELEEKLSSEEFTPFEIKIRPEYRPSFIRRPAFVLATIAMLLIAISVYLLGGLPTKSRLTAFNDERLLDDIEALEELTGELVVLDDQDFILDEMILLEEMS